MPRKMNVSEREPALKFAHQVLKGAEAKSFGGFNSRITHLSNGD